MLGGTTVTVNANSVFDLNGNNQALTALTLNDGGSAQTGNGALSLADGSSVNVGSLNGLGSHASSTLSGNITLPSDGSSATFNVAAHASTPPLLFTPELEVPATVSGGSTMILNVLYKYGLGQLEFTGNNTFSEQVRINEGTLIAGSAGALGSGSGGTFVYNGASLALDGGVTISGESLVLDSTNAAALDSRSGSNCWAGPVNLTGNNQINVANSLSAYGIISGSGGLTKVGAGLLTWRCFERQRVFRGHLRQRRHAGHEKRPIEHPFHRRQRHRGHGPRRTSRDAAERERRRHRRQGDGE